MNKLYFFLSLCSFLVIGSCKKTEVDNETASSTDYALATQEFIQVFCNVNESSLHQKGLYNPYTLGDTAIGRIDSLSGDTTHDAQGTFTNTSNLPTLWMQYSNNVGYDNKTRKGTVKVYFTKQYDQVGSVATIAFANYSVNDVSYQGTITITRNSGNTFGYGTANGICSYKNGSVKYSCNNAISLFDNGTLSDASDDYVKVSGTANGTNTEKRNFVATISELIVKRTNCSWFSQGIVDITPDGLHKRNLDFGNGTCDDIAAFVVDGQTFTVHMGK